MVQGTVTRWLSAAFVLLSALVVFSCQKTGRPAASPAAVAPPAASAGTPPGTVQGAPPAVTPAAAAPATQGAQAQGRNAAAPAQPPAPPGKARGAIALQPPPAAAPLKSLANAGSLMAMGRDGRMLPEDFKIGPLGDALEADKAEDAALEAAGQFLTGLVGGKVDKNLVAEDARDTLAGTLG
ncbi:MAG TPA: hypothetical protein VL359_02965, partial [bacterium]|nr:hypothetical protein [bacterium]